MAPPGYLALILHAHLPFVRHPEHPRFLEEEWLFEAITESYLPLLEMFERLADEGVPFALTLSLSPTLCAMLRDPLLQERYLQYLERCEALARAEMERPRENPREQALYRFYQERFARSRQLFVERWGGDLPAAFGRLQERGVLELITCAATHPFLPLMEPFPEAVRAQILLARDAHRECFGRDPRGLWLPECGYFPGLEKTLAEANIRWFTLDAHGLLFGTPRPRFAIYAPCFTPSGPAAFARDRDSSRQVWSAEEGYPGAPAYRDFYRDAGFDLPEEALSEFFAPGEARRFTGLKLHRITGRNGHEKELYDPAEAEQALRVHAHHFLAAREEQITALRERLPVEPIVVAPFDAELFGHWWFEGPRFLELFLRQAAHSGVFSLTTPGRYLETHPTAQVLSPSASSWGDKGYSAVWLDKSNAWIYPHLHMAARRMTELASDLAEEELPPFMERALTQLARELLLAQASDWAFLIKTGTASAYAERRTREHLARFTRLYEQIRHRKIQEKFLAMCEARDNLFPSLPWRYYEKTRSHPHPAP